jgi:hypothetical protein
LDYVSLHKAYDVSKETKGRYVGSVYVGPRCPPWRKTCCQETLGYSSDHGGIAVWYRRGLRGVERVGCKGGSMGGCVGGCVGLVGGVGGLCFPPPAGGGTREGLGGVREDTGFGHLPPKEKPGHLYAAWTAHKAMAAAGRRLAPSRRPGCGQHSGAGQRHTGTPRATPAKHVSSQLRGDLHLYPSV